MAIHGAWDSGTVSGATLSNGDKTFTSTAPGAFVDSTDFHAAGKYYVEVNTTTVASTNDFIGFWDTPGFAFFVVLRATGVYSTDTSSGATTVTWTSGDVLGLAVDLTAGLVWFRNGSGLWNGSAAGNPVTGVDGIAFTPNGDTVLEADAAAAGSVYTINTGPSFANAKPSGYIDWFIPAAEPMLPWAEPVRHTIDPTLGIALIASGGFAPPPELIRADKWFQPFSEPVRFKRGLEAWLQQAFAAPPRLLPTPDITGTMAAQETAQDTFLGAGTTFNASTSAEIGVIDTSTPVAEIGVAVPTVASVRVSIRIL